VVATQAGDADSVRLAPILATQSIAPKSDSVVAASFEAAPAEPIRPTPAIPSRSMPLPIDPDGHVVELPPLPIAVSSIDHAIKPAANQPSPQTVNLSAIDPAVTQSGFVAPAPGVTTSVISSFGPTLGLGLQMRDERGTPIHEVEKDLSGALKAPGKTETALVPLGGSLMLEIKATVVPAATADRGVDGDRR
jgi:hypothetical protein